AKLERINVTSNFLGIWHDPPAVDPPSECASVSGEGSTSTLVQHEEVHRKASTSSLNGSASSSHAPLVHSLKRLYLGENRLTDDALHPIMHLRELRVLNLSFNELQDLPTRFFRELTQLEELYLSGNKIASIPTEDLHRLEKLRTLYLNGNRLITLPQELQMLRALTSLDVGSNQLKYNTNNFEFDWNWNFNKTLKYLNLSGNKRLQIKVEKRQTYYGHGPPRHPNAPSSNLSSFTDLTQLRVLGLMDVTLPTVRNGSADTPEEMDDRRVRTSASTVLKMSYGIADALGKNDTLNMLDLVQEIKIDTQNVGAVFAMFGRSQPLRPGYPGAHANRLAKYLRDRFVGNFVFALNNMKYGDDVPDALRRSFLEMNRSLIQ
ncbi:Adenylate cyclase, partial [Termitomyces sp. T112]